MSSQFREEIKDALARRGDVTALTSQGVQGVPAPLVLADLVLRECVLAVQRGLEGWAPASSLPNRVRLYAGPVGEPRLVGAEDVFWTLLGRVWTSGDAPAVESFDEIGLPVVCERVLTIGDLDTSTAVEFGQLLGDLGCLKATSMVLEQGGAIGLPVVGRMAPLDGPSVEGVAAWGLSGAPIRIRVKGGAEPEICLSIDLPAGRIPAGVLGSRGVLAEDVRGAEGVRDMAMAMPYVLAGNLALGRLDDDAAREGGAAVGFAGRVSATFDVRPLGPVGLLEEVTAVLPHLARQRKDRQEIQDEFSAVVLAQGISALVARGKADPARGKELSLQLLNAGFAPHVKDLDVYWIPVGEYPEPLPPDALDRVVVNHVELI